MEPRRTGGTGEPTNGKDQSGKGLIDVRDSRALQDHDGNLQLKDIGGQDKIYSNEGIVISK